MHEKPTRKIIFAAGGTGGHILPAQALARSLKEEDPDLEILFAGDRLATNRFFHHHQFSFREISSSTPYRNKPLSSVMQLGKGVRQSLKLFQEFSPDLIVGFGSFYSFPILTAARIKRIPYILIESNAFPGKVNRLFSRGALFSAIQFQEANQWMKGECRQTKMPYWSQEKKTNFVSKAEARKHYNLDPEIFTLLVFGGSQGAAPLNQACSDLKMDEPFQVIHFCGNDQDPKELMEKYKKQGIKAYVKCFEEQIHLAWRSADLVISRAGAGTLSEHLEFAVPAILIPWPGSADGHQMKNAEIMGKRGGALVLDQSKIELLGMKIKEAREKIETMQQNLRDLQKIEELQDLNSLVLTHLQDSR